MTQPVTLSVVIPAKNEEACLPALVHEICDVLLPLTSFEVIIVDDGSTDQTYAATLGVLKQRECRFVVLRNQSSVGQSTAIALGASKAQGRYLVMLDADGQNDPRDIPRLLELAEQQTQADFCIMGHRQKRQDSDWVRFQSKVANAVRSRILQDDTPDSGCALKLLPLTTYRKLPYFNHMHRFMPALVRRHGGAIMSVPISHRARTAGQSHYNALNRTLAGLLDLMGVAWLLHRTRRTEIAQIESSDC